LKKSALVFLLLLSLLPGNVAAQVKTPDTFRGSEGVDQNSIGDLKWFEVFKDPELQQLVRTAMVHNYDLRLAGARINALVSLVPSSYRSLKPAQISPRIVFPVTASWLVRGRAASDAVSAVFY
jgi:outer membrane protein TolC